MNCIQKLCVLNFFSETIKQTKMSLSFYEKHEKLGEGSYGVVYRATDIRDGSMVALKILKLETLEDGVPSTLLREISILKNCTHINIVRLTDVCTSKLPIFLAFEYLDTDLRVLLNHVKRPLKPTLVKSYAFQLLAGVYFIHSHRIIHRDIKPDNILLSKKNGILKICDFGMARYFTVPMRPYTKGVVTLWYKAPELLVSSPYDLSIDIWSVGCILFEMATGKPLFPGDGHMDQLMKIISILGTPSEDECPGFSAKVTTELGFELPMMERTGLLDYLETRDFVLVDLMEKMLHFDPAKRITAKEALEHPYFNDIPIDMRKACIGVSSEE